MDLVSAFIGAAIAVVAQWIITPRVERRMRAQERWEQDVLELGHLLTVELPAVRDEARWSWFAWYSFQKLVAGNDDLDPDDPRIVAEREREQEAAKKAAEAFEQLVQVRMRWLTQRVALRFERFDSFERAAQVYHMHTILLTKPFAWDLDGTLVDQEPQWEKERANLERVVREVEKIAEQIGPGRPGPLAIQWRRVQRWRRRKLRERQDRKALDRTGGTNEIGP